MIFDVIEWVGALGVLSAFALAQMGKLSVDSVRYDAINLISGALLAAAGIPGRQWGFVVLNGAWAAIALHALVAREKSR